MQLISCLNAASMPNLHDTSSSRVVLAQGTVGGSKYSTVQESTLIVPTVDADIRVGQNPVPLQVSFVQSTVMSPYRSLTQHPCLFSSLKREPCSLPKLAHDFSDALSCNGLTIILLLSHMKLFFFLRENPQISTSL